jgi:uncharacterized integral membrane protein
VKNVKYGLIAVVVLLVIAVFLQNLEPVEFRFWPFAPLRVAKTVIIAVSAVAGSVATLVVELYWKRRKQETAASSPSGQA